MSYLHIKTDEKFDFSTKQLFYVYIPEYNTFKDAGFCFHPEYEVSKKNYEENDGINRKLEIHVQKKKGFIDLFKNKNINLKILCGKNGTGKTTLLKLLSGEKHPELVRIAQVKKIETENINKKILKAINNTCVYVFIDKNGRFASTAETTIFYNHAEILLNSTKQSFNFEEKDWCGNEIIDDKRDKFTTFKQNIVDVYCNSNSNIRNLFDSYLDNPLFTHFYVCIWDQESLINSFVTGRHKELFDEDDYTNLLLKNNYLQLYFFYLIQDSKYDSIFNDLYKSFKETGNFFYSFVDFIDNLISIEKSNEQKKFNEKAKVVFNKRYSITEYNVALKEIEDLSEIANGIMTKIIQDDNLYSNFSDLLYLEGFNEQLNRHIDDFSTGELNALFYRYQIYEILVNRNCGWWYIDEPELGLHPEWCRLFLNDYIQAFTDTKKYLNKISSELKGRELRNNLKRKMTIIISTHSPFILSDVTNDYVIYLEKQKGKTKESKLNINSFAGNIGQMYSTNFFMENTIGEFAKNKLIDIIKDFEKKEITATELTEYKLLVNKIGDDLLQKLLLDKLESYGKNKVIR